MPDDGDRPSRATPRLRAASSTTPDQRSIDDETYEKIAQLGAVVRRSVVLLESPETFPPTIGVCVEPSLLVTSASNLDTGDQVGVLPAQGTGEEPREATVLERASGDDRGDDLVALGVDTDLQALSAGTVDELAPGDIVIQVGSREFSPSPTAWLTQYGRVRRFTDDGRFVSTLPFETPGGPVLTLDCSLVAPLIRTGKTTDLPADETPPQTAEDTVCTHSHRWTGIRHGPIGTVRSRISEWTA